MSEQTGSEDRRGLPAEDEERGRYTEGDDAGTGVMAGEGEPRRGADDAAGEYPEGQERARENEPEGNDPDIAVRPPDE